MKHGSEVPSMILLQAYLYTYSLLRGVTFKVLPLLEYLCTYPNDAAIVGNIFGTPVVK
jgi:hypothetical protein